MIERRGDIFKQPDADAIVFTANGVLNNRNELVMGKGIALAFKERWPKLPEIFGQYVRDGGNKVWVYTGPNDNLKPAIVSFPTKHHWRNPSDIKLIETSAKELALTADDFGWKRIYLSWPGCGLGQLSKDDVRKVVAPILDDRFVVLTY